MSAVDLAAVVVTIVCLVVVVILVLAVQALVATLRQLRETIDELRGESLPMFDDLRTTVTKAGDELERVDEVIGRVERVVATADVASRLTQKVFTPPLIKTAAIMKGAGRATLTLRRGRSRKAIPARKARTMHSSRGTRRSRKSKVR
ncbi:MAG: hypothetical protein F4Y27_14895 [Acidimicrobiaceae bacterium]|nr:hypothetical protein [Acidimicrobiaceae bacterium]MXW61993.1 hypothetical protein [Acidimicrobiaceae bacterium]MXW76468.1 hypothetical protein [Acidimicrobiaceae bacterium]MYA75948.1 hypothetical protein [Acidimicrobiaceae bacterium]MYC41286.1 hypothetical protein [Acidimicrobiaceae bacterium]